jgi:hypothetical protein
MSKFFWGVFIRERDANVKLGCAYRRQCYNLRGGRLRGRQRDKLWLMTLLLLERIAR